jgi:hypothetical protein
VKRIFKHRDHVATVHIIAPRRPRLVTRARLRRSDNHVLRNDVCHIYNSPAHCVLSPLTQTGHLICLLGGVFLFEQSDIDGDSAEFDFSIIVLGVVARNQLHERHGQMDDVVGAVA